jgi:hypothetical protein
MQENGIKYRFAIVKDPFTKDNAFFNNAKRPLEDQFIDTIAKDVDWSEFVWGERSLMVRGVKYSPLKNYKYY